MTHYTHEQIARVAAADRDWSARLAAYYVNFAPDDAFVALNAPGMVAQLLARVEKLEAENERLREETKAICFHQKMFGAWLRARNENKVEGVDDE